MYNIKNRARGSFRTGLPGKGGFARTPEPPPPPLATGLTLDPSPSSASHIGSSMFATCLYLLPFLLFLGTFYHRSLSPAACIVSMSMLTAAFVSYHLQVSNYGRFLVNDPYPLSSHGLTTSTFALRVIPLSRRTVKKTLYRVTIFVF